MSFDFFFFFLFRPGRKTEQTQMPTLQKPHKADNASPPDEPFPSARKPKCRREMVKNIGLGFRSASSRRAQGSGRTYLPTLRQSGHEPLTNPTAGSAMAVEQGLKLHKLHR